MKLTYAQMQGASDALNELQRQVDYLKELIHPLYPDNSDEHDSHIVEDLRMGAKEAAILGARVQGKLSVIGHILNTENLAPIPATKRDVWCNEHHQLDDC